MSARNITRTGQASSCYFRTTADGGTRKALVQIDERCNLHCAHCFVSATRVGQSMSYDDITSLLIPRLKACRVERVTLTGGDELSNVILQTLRQQIRVKTGGNVQAALGRG